MTGRYESDELAMLVGFGCFRRLLRRITTEPLADAFPVSINAFFNCERPRSSFGLTDHSSFSFLHTSYLSGWCSCQ